MKEIELTQGYKAMVDDEDFEKVSQYKWWLNKGKNNRLYAYRGAYNKHTQKANVIYMHRLIMDCPNDFMVDHIDHCGLNNQKSNLRICTCSQNHMNKRKTRGRSKYKGIIYIRNKYIIAQIKCNGINIYLGIFKTEKEAAEAYNKKAIELFGEYACLNVI